MGETSNQLTTFSPTEVHWHFGVTYYFHLHDHRVREAIKKQAANGAADLTPWSWVFLQKLTDAQLINISPSYFTKYKTSVPRSQQLATYRCPIQINPLNCVTTFIVIISYHQRLRLYLHISPRGISTPLQHLHAVVLSGKVAHGLNELSTTPWRRMGKWMYRSRFSWPRN
jgi:hypothetical protein